MNSKVLTHAMVDKQELWSLVRGGGTEDHQWKLQYHHTRPFARASHGEGCSGLGVESGHYNSGYQDMSQKDNLTDNIWGCYSV